MAASQTQICNLALGWLCQTLLTSINDPGTPARLCRDNFDGARDAVLEDNARTFPTARRKPTPDPISPVSPF